MIEPDNNKIRAALADGRAALCYVAGDPAHPETAWALCVDDPKFAKYTARDIGRWAKAGARIERVTATEAIQRLRAWRAMQKAETNAAPVPAPEDEFAGGGDQ